MKTLAIAVFLCMTTSAMAGLLGGDFDARRGTVTIRVVKPPERYLTGKTMRVKIGAAPKSFTRQTELLTALERALSSQFVRAENGDPDLTFVVDVIAYDAPAVREYDVKEKRNVKVGERPLYNDDGTPKKGLLGGQATQAIYEEQMLPIGYWEGTGRLEIRLSVAARGGSATVDSVAASAEYSVKTKLSDPAPQASLADMGRDLKRMIGFGQKKEEATRPTATGLDLQFIEEVTAKASGRFAKSVAETSTVLATEASLSAGTALAVAGDWAAAIESWEKAPIKNSKNDWMRLYNLGVGHIALAFHIYDEGGDSAQAGGLFDRGGQLLLKSAELKPSEKHVTEALQQYARFKDAMANVAIEAAARGAAERKAMADIAAQREKLLKDKRPDTAKEQEFRQLVAVRIKGAKGLLAGDDKSELEQIGQKGYGLTTIQSQRIVFQESRRLEAAAEAIETYTTTFSSLVDDGVLSVDEKEVLRGLAKNLDIPRSSVESVHKRFTYEDAAPQKTQGTTKPKSGKD